MKGCGAAGGDMFDVRDFVLFGLGARARREWRGLGSEEEGGEKRRRRSKRERPSPSPGPPQITKHDNKLLDPNANP
jgi:hypothetical protein